MSIRGDQTKIISDSESEWSNEVRRRRSRWSIKRTQGGTTRYYYQEKLVKSSQVPTRVRDRLEFYLHGWSPYAQSLTSTNLIQHQETLKKTQTEYRFKDYGIPVGAKRRTIQYYRGKFRVPKRCVPPWEYERMRERFRKAREQYQEKHKSFPGEESSESSRKQEESENTREDSDSKKDSEGVPPPISEYLKAKQLLERMGISDRKSWRKWSMKNHPDKNPEIDVELVAMVNAAVDYLYS